MLRRRIAANVFGAVAGVPIRAVPWAGNTAASSAALFWHASLDGCSTRARWTSSKGPDDKQSPQAARGRRGARRGRANPPLPGVDDAASEYVRFATPSTTPAERAAFLRALIEKHNWRPMTGTLSDCVGEVVSNYTGVITVVGVTTQTKIATTRLLLLRSFLPPAVVNHEPLLECAVKAGFHYAETVHVFGPAEDIDALERRYVNPPRDVRDAVAASRPIIVADRVVVISGSSGSGKTDLSLTSPHVGAEKLVVVYLSASNVGKDFDPTSMPKATEAQVKLARNMRAVSAVTEAVELCLASLCDGVRSDWRTGNKSIHLRVVMDEMGNRPHLVRGLIAEQKKIRQALKTTYHLGGASLVVVGTGVDDPQQPPGSLDDNFTMIYMDRETGGFKVALERSIPKEYAAVMQSETGAMSSATVKAMLSNPRLGSLIVLSLTEHTNLRGMGTINGLHEGHPVHAPNPQSLRMGLEMCALAAIGHFRLFGGMMSLKSDEVREILADALAIDAGSYDSLSDDIEHVSRLRIKYGCLVDRATLVSRAKLTVGANGVVRGTATDFRVLEADTENMLIVPLDCFGRYRLPEAYRAMFLAIAAADCVTGSVATADDLEQAAWVWLGLLSVLTTPENTVQRLLELQCTQPVNGVDVWKKLRPTEPFTSRNVRAWVRRGHYGDPAPADTRGVQLLRTRKEFPFPMAIKDGALRQEVRRLPAVVKKQIWTASSLCLPFCDAIWKPHAICLLNAPRAPAEDVHLRVPAANNRPSETVMLQVKRHLSKPLTHCAITEELAKTGVLLSQANRFSGAARAVRRLDASQHKTFVFVTVLGPTASRSAKWSAVERLPETTDSGAVNVMFHECHVNADGHVELGAKTKKNGRTKQDGSVDGGARPFLFPLFFGGVGQA